MHRSILRLTCSSMPLLALLCGCTQMTRHSNTMVFATDTGIGLKIGQGANQQPAIEIGYNRQEVALVPLLANTSSGTTGNLQPCPTGGASIADCHFRASHDGKDRDAYSTMASFGTKVNAGTTGSMAVAQFFATGIAAQRLTLAGANLVQVTGDPEVAVANADAATQASEAILQQERNNAQKVQSVIEKGRIVAKSILGDSTAAVTTASIVRLVEKIREQDRIGCEAANFAELPQTSVDAFLQKMAEDMAPCLLALGAAVEQ